MAIESDLKSIQTRVYMSFFEDGLWDIVLGVFTLSWGLGILTDTAAFTGIWFMAAYFIAFNLKKRITCPRIGHITIPQQRRTILRLVIIGVVVLVAGIFVFWFAQMGIALSLRAYFMFIFGTIIAAVIFLIAYWWRIKRWYAYAAAILVGASLHQWQNVALEWSFIIPGIIILASGTTVFLRFLRHYPKPPEDLELGHK
ncbi:hypothetical protein ACFLTJ_00215 [Chloroflexota bacterium]